MLYFFMYLFMFYPFPIKDLKQFIKNNLLVGAILDANIQKVPKKERASKQGIFTPR